MSVGDKCGGDDSAPEPGLRSSGLCPCRPRPLHLLLPSHHLFHLHNLSPRLHRHDGPRQSRHRQRSEDWNSWIPGGCRWGWKWHGDGGWGGGDAGGKADLDSGERFVPGRGDASRDERMSNGVCRVLHVRGFHQWVPGVVQPENTGAPGK